MKKNYIKLIGSIICALSVIITVGVVTIGAQADDKSITYVENVKYEKDNTVPTTPEGYEGYLFAGWYEEGGENANKAGYSVVTNPVEGQSYWAKYVPSEVLGLQAQVSTQIKDNDTDKIQNNSKDNAIRFVTSLDSLEYNHIGFNIKIDGTSYNQDAAVSKDVYTQIYGIGADKETIITYDPTVFDDESIYIKTYTFTAIPETAFNSDITVTPYWITLDGTRVNGPEAVVRTVNYCRAWVYADSTGAVTNADAPAGTYSNPYSDLQTALDVNGQELIPKVILKSDYELSAGVTASQALTLASEKDENENVKSIKIAETWNADRMLTIGTADVNADVTLEDITIDGVDNGAGVLIYNGDLLMKSGSTITRGKAQAGGNVEVDNSKVKNCTLTMEEGSVISGGTATGTGNYIRGGNIILEAGTLTLNGGTITGGEAIASANTSESNTGCGGNIHSYGAGTINLVKGEISEGTVSSPADVASTGIGGNICSAGTVNVEGGTISGGSATSTHEAATTVPIGCGGNIFSTGTVNVTGGTITGGEATSTTTSEILPSVTVDETVTEGNIGCGGNIYSANKVNVSGGTISAGAAANGANIYSTTTLNVSGNATITGGQATVSGGNVYTSGSLTMTGGTISSGTAVDGSTYKIGVGGNICAAGVDTDNYATVTITGGTIQGGQVEGRGGNINAYQNVNIILGTENATSNDAAIITGGIAGVTSTTANGGNIFARGNSTITVYDGVTIKDGKASNQGGNIFLDSNKTFDIKGGVIQDGEAKQGGNICGSSKLNGTVSGGVIKGGNATSTGGNVYFEGKLQVTGGEISGGTAANGGNIYVWASSTANATLTMKGGTIKDGTATTNGGNIYLNSVVNSAGDAGDGAEFIMDNGTISGGKAVLGGSIYIQRSNKKVDNTTTYYEFEATMTMNNGLIEKGWATGEGGGNIYCRGILTMNGGIIQQGIAGTSSKKARGGNVFVKADSKTAETGEFYLNGGQVINGYATERGGNIHLAHANLYLGSELFEVAGGDIVTITGTEAESLVLTTTGTTTYDNVSLFSNSDRNIKITETLNTDSRIYVTASTAPTASNIAAIANILTTDVEEESFYTSIIKYEGSYTIKLKNTDELWYEAAE